MAVSKKWGPCLGVLVIKIIVYWFILGPVVLGHSHMPPTAKPRLGALRRFKDWMF